jgi:hypothetical protein
MVAAFCEDAAAWLAARPDNIVAVHCKAGKSRTGLMVCAALLQTEDADPSAERTLAFYGSIRTSDGRGVTIPSQRRYVHYYAEQLRAAAAAAAAGPGIPRVALVVSPPRPRAVRLTDVRFWGLPHDCRAPGGDRQRWCCHHSCQATTKNLIHRGVLYIQSRAVGWDDSAALARRGLPQRSSHRLDTRDPRRTGRAMSGSAVAERANRTACSLCESLPA